MEPVRWLATESSIKPDAVYLARTVKSLAAMKSAEFYLASESGDEWLDVLDSGGGSRAGEVVLVDRGERLRISFNAICSSSRDMMTGYVYTGEAEISDTGELVLRGAGPGILATHAASDKVIILDSNNDNWLRFGRVNDLLAEEEKCSEESRSVSAETVASDASPMEICIIAGMEEFNIGSIGWEFTFRGPEILEAMSKASRQSGGWAPAQLTTMIGRRLNRMIYEAVKAAICGARCEGGHLAAKKNQESQKRLLDRVRTRLQEKGACSPEIEDLARSTGRYSLSYAEPGFLEVVDNRRLLVGLLQWQAVVPDESTGGAEFEELRKQMGTGPILNAADQDVLDWLHANAECQPHKDDALFLEHLHALATVFRGSEEETRRFLLNELDQPSSLPREQSCVLDGLERAITLEGEYEDEFE